MASRGTKGHGLRPNPFLPLESAATLTSYLRFQALRLRPNPSQTPMFHPRRRMASGTKFCHWEIKIPMTRLTSDLSSRCCWRREHQQDGVTSRQRCVVIMQAIEEWQAFAMILVCDRNKTRLSTYDRLSSTK